MILLWSNCSGHEETADSLLVVLSVATATLAFFLNLMQLVVIVHQRLLHLHKHLVMLHLCLCGQLSCAPVLCGLLMAPPLSPPALAPALHLLSIFTFAPLITLLVLQQHPLGRPPRALALLLLLAWCRAILISLVPLTGWLNARPASFAALVCALYFLHYPLVLILLVDLCLRRRSNRVGIVPDIESSVGQLLKQNVPSMDQRSAYSHINGLSSVVQPFKPDVSLMTQRTAYVYTNSQTSVIQLLKQDVPSMTQGTAYIHANGQSSVGQFLHQDVPSMDQGLHPSLYRKDTFEGGPRLQSTHCDIAGCSVTQARNDILLVCLWSACTLPFFCHTALMAGHSQQDFCDALVANERTALWTSWMTMLFAAARPVFHAQLEDDLGEGTVTFINVLCRVRNPESSTSSR